ncbi:MAG: sugar phosphate nucleotidyltransferase [Solirubrobacterales bacterium]
MQAVVLVGGEGTRLRPLTLDVPKPALTLVDRPFVRFVVDWLGGHGVDEVVMACGFKADDLRAALGDEVPGGPRIRYLEEPAPLGTGGPLRLAADRGVLADRFLALNGDVLADLDLGALIELHEARDAAATLALYPVEDPSAYGLVRRAEDGEVRGFLEKPDPGEIDTDEINAGAYVLERSVIDLIPAGRAVSIEREVFPPMVGQGLYGRRLEGYWMDIGTPERYLRSSWDILEGRVETAVEATGPGLLVAPEARVAEGAEIGPRAVVRGGCEIAEGARVAESVVLDGCVVGERAVVEGAILAEDVSVGEDAEITKGAVIGAGASIGPGAAVAPGVRIQPGESVEAEALAP